MSKKEKFNENTIRNLVLSEYTKGNIVVSSFDGISSMPLAEFLKQPAEGILYDLNRCEAVVLTFIKDPKWVNDYAVAKVITELKTQLGVAQSIIDNNKRDLKNYTDSSKGAEAQLKSVSKTFHQYLDQKGLRKSYQDFLLSII